MATIEELESLRWDLRRDCVDIIMAAPAATSAATCR